MDIEYIIIYRIKYLNDSHQMYNCIDFERKIWKNLVILLNFSWNIILKGS